VASSEAASALVGLVFSVQPAIAAMTHTTSNLNLRAPAGAQIDIDVTHVHHHKNGLINF